ncbi:hypothetical protein Hlac_3500 (plasmid) [Halorubrum lacusprofundi ATCC 49239]|uniref:Uncharacterized protein n=1 Tax=Halorubrum lacusprofundi (strain ATCC 49239 / DSM 5036 / JCM 8891 / ACAM 34) TaxID=416348 RepID=B9LX18_HALLT|nr:hypothetical protein Hlac_3500 [Halorubrum lacusprofundi ATCC 49239]
MSLNFLIPNHLLSSLLQIRILFLILYSRNKSSLIATLLS